MKGGILLTVEYADLIFTDLMNDVHTDSSYVFYLGQIVGIRECFRHLGYLEACVKLNDMFVAIQVRDKKRESVRLNKISGNLGL